MWLTCAEVAEVADDGWSMVQLGMTSFAPAHLLTNISKPLSKIWFWLPISTNCHQLLTSSSTWTNLNMQYGKGLCSVSTTISLFFAAILLNGTSSLLLSLTEQEPYHTSILTGEGWWLLGDDLWSGRRLMPETKLISRCCPKDDSCCLIYKRTHILP